MEIYYCYQPIKVYAEGKWLYLVTVFEATSSVFNTIGENDSFPVSTPGPWSSRGDAPTNEKLQKF